MSYFNLSLLLALPPGNEPPDREEVIQSMSLLENLLIVRHLYSIGSYKAASIHAKTATDAWNAYVARRERGKVESGETEKKPIDNLTIVRHLFALQMSLEHALRLVIEHQDEAGGLDVLERAITKWQEFISDGEHNNAPEES